MTNPTLWLDLLVAIAGIGAVVAFLVQRPLAPSPKKGRLKQLAGYSLAACVMLSGSDRLLTRALSPRINCTGTITVLYQEGGGRGNYAHAYLVVSDSSGTNHYLNIGTVSSALKKGETVSVEFLAGTRTAVRIDVIDGPNQGERVEDFPLMGWIIILCGGFIVFRVVLNAQVHPDGESSTNFDRESPSDDIDEDSLLNLKKP